MLQTILASKKAKSPPKKSGKFATANFPGAILMGTFEAARFLGLSIGVLIREAAAGKIPAFKIGGKWVFSRPALEAWIAESIQRGV